MTTKGRKRHREPWREVLLDELSDETEDERRDFADSERNPFESEHCPEMGHDGDDNPTYAGAKPRFDGEKLESGDISDPVQISPRENPAGEIVDAGHGFRVDDRRSRPWKTAPRTHCALCGDRMPPPDVSKYPCEFEPDATDFQLATLGDGVGERWPLRTTGCQCSGCILRRHVRNGAERNKGQPRKYCSTDCRKLADAERGRWKRAVAKADRLGLEPPPEPEDRGLKFITARGLRATKEGNGHRY
ncbi:hypothetical protein MFTT_06590 [Mycolicibacterium fortuitum subsp. fortuitum]|nr:hypothetical protein MFTT_06590 [Mycolicibacterium fortuitum subsp. fortuitum]